MWRLVGCSRFRRDGFVFVEVMRDICDMQELWSNKSLQATRDGGSSSAIADDVISPACLSSGR